MALDWARYHLSRKGGPDVYRPGNEYFSLPKTSLGELVKQIQAKLHLLAPRVIGEPQARVSKAALTHGFLLVADLQRVMREPGVDVVVAGEPVEWEASEYFEDLIEANMSKGLILLGNEASEDPGSGKAAHISACPIHVFHRGSI